MQSSIGRMTSHLTPLGPHPGLVAICHGQQLRAGWLPLPIRSPVWLTVLININ
jgi:hypothetical protein